MLLKNVVIINKDIYGKTCRKTIYITNWNVFLPHPFRWQSFDFASNLNVAYAFDLISHILLKYSQFGENISHTVSLMAIVKRLWFCFSNEHAHWINKYVGISPSKLPKYHTQSITQIIYIEICVFLHNHSSNTHLSMSFQNAHHLLWYGVWNFYMNSYFTIFSNEV